MSENRDISQWEKAIFLILGFFELKKKGIKKPRGFFQANQVGIEIFFFREAAPGVFKRRSAKPSVPKARAEPGNEILMGKKFPLERRERR